MNQRAACVHAQDAIYPFTEAMFQGVSTVLFNFGTLRDRARFLYHRDSADDDQVRACNRTVTANRLHN